MVVEGAVVRSAKDKPVSWVISPPVIRRGLVPAITLLVASAAVLPFVPSLAIFGIAGIFFVLGGSILVDNVTSREPILDPRLGTLFIVVALGTLAVAIVGATT